MTDNSEKWRDVALRYAVPALMGMLVTIIALFFATIAMAPECPPCETKPGIFELLIAGLAMAPGPLVAVWLSRLSD